MIKSDLSNGRESPVSDPIVRPGRKGTRLALGHGHKHSYIVSHKAAVSAQSQT